LQSEGQLNFKLPNSLNSIFILNESAFKKFLQVYTLQPSKLMIDSDEFFITYKNDIKELISYILLEQPGIKLQFVLHVTMIRDIADHSAEQPSYFVSVARPLTNIKLFHKLFFKSINDIESNIQEYTNKGSGWRVKNINKLEIKIGKYLPLYGSCFIELPSKLKYKRAIINIKNNDGMCFLYSIISTIFKPKELRRKVNVNFCKKFISKFNLNNIKFPMELKNISKFEKLNKHLNLSINVYEWNSKKDIILPLIISKNNEGNNIYLLFYRNHYFCINNFNRLLG
jgi:hypothetical protein